VNILHSINDKCPPAAWDTIHGGIRRVKKFAVCDEIKQIITATAATIWEEEIQGQQLVLHTCQLLVSPAGSPGQELHMDTWDRQYNAILYLTPGASTVFLACDYVNTEAENNYYPSNWQKDQHVRAKLVYPGDVIFFPSNRPHAAHPAISERRVIFFNMRIKGKKYLTTEQSVFEKQHYTEWHSDNASGVSSSSNTEHEHKKRRSTNTPKQQLCAEKSLPTEVTVGNGPRAQTLKQFRFVIGKDSTSYGCYGVPKAVSGVPDTHMFPAIKSNTADFVWRLGTACEYRKRKYTILGFLLSDKTKVGRERRVCPISVVMVNSNGTAWRGNLISVIPAGNPEISSQRTTELVTL